VPIGTIFSVVLPMARNRKV